MVKKKSVATKKVVGRKAVSSKSKAGAKSVSKTRWYIWVLIGLLFVIIGNQVYKYVATRQDVALLDSAEEKMRQLDFPGGEKGEIERYCSERSVKFGSSGKPTCGISVSYDLLNSKSITNTNTQTIQKSITENGGEVSQYRADDDRVYYKLGGYSEGLYCYMGDVLVTDYKTNDTTQNLTIYCQKEFQTKLYPIGG